MGLQRPSKAGRLGYNHFDEESLFHSWKRKAHSFIDYAPDNDWDWLALAQHHGLATRLLDWTYNPLAACYFAVRNEFDEDSVVYAFIPKYDAIKGAENQSPFKRKKVGIYKPKGISARIMGQSGLFTLHGPPELDIKVESEYRENIEKIIIDEEYKKTLLFELSHYGYNELTLFPDLDGLSRHTNWHVQNSSFWGNENIE